ncbi:uncharacterized acetyltransferase At3g50280 [Punica granatum]|uniref:BAHD acyltransferase DCR n=2 Tax=Punica granatum TaxID=22663 RepID=A0A218WD35_PUNGR|nr:uncharacterized acetyltransferase At3g50280 [Punica granatum]OWM69982.1 hypothetical protein CDL15_Pgr025831 [Punica granatum]PKI39596.1 hypothetical protein CRG98_040066 [Punica granatum]
MPFDSVPSRRFQTLTVVSKCTVFPSEPSAMGDLKLSVSDLPMLSCHYIQKGNLFPLPDRPPLPSHSLVSVLRLALSRALTYFPPLAGHLLTDSKGYVHITCNDAGVEFVHARAESLSIQDILGTKHVPKCVKKLFLLDRTVSYEGHFKPILAVQVTELSDGVFIGCSVNHAVMDGTSFWNFFNTFAEVCRTGVRKVSRIPDFSRDSVLISPAVLKLPDGGPRVTFNENEPLAERIFSFSRESILKLKAKVNGSPKWKDNDNGYTNAVEVMGKQSNDPLYLSGNGKKVERILEGWFHNGVSEPAVEKAKEISSFQSICALLWRLVTRARRLPAHKMTTFRMAVNVRHRLKPKLDASYFGNAIQSIPTHALAAELLSHDLRWCAEQLNKTVAAHGDDAVRRLVEDWEREPRCFPLGNPDGASITMGSSPRFPMYENDFGWGRPVAVRSGRANKFDGKISAFPGREGGGSVDLEVVLAPETMSAVESDMEFMQYVSSY